MSIKIAITDDHPMVREGIKSMLLSSGEYIICGMYVNGSNCLSGLRQELPDVLLLDLSLPDINGAELVPKLRTEFPDLPIIIITSIDSVILIKSLINSGINGYLLKTSNHDLLTKAITSVRKGELFLAPEIQSILANSVVKTAISGNKSMQLTEKETEIIRLIAHEYTSQEIAEKVHLSVRTVDNYRLGLMQKMDVKNLAGLVRKAILMGIVE